MKSLQIKTKKLRLKIKKNERNFVISNILIKFFALKKKKKSLFALRYKNFFFKNYFHKKSKNYINNRCNITNRSKNIKKNFGVSRFVLRNLMSFGIIPGYKKAIW